MGSILVHLFRRIKTFGSHHRMLEIRRKIPGKPEVNEDNLPFRSKHQISGLDIPMIDKPFMDIIKDMETLA